MFIKEMKRDERKTNPEIEKQTETNDPVYQAYNISIKRKEFKLMYVYSTLTELPQWDIFQEPINKQRNSELHTAGILF